MFFKNIMIFLSSKDVSFWQKFKVIFMIFMTGIYLISPIDIVPDFIPLFGYLEDIVVTYAMFYYIGNLVKKHIQNISKDKIIVDVEFSKNPKNDDEK